MKTFLRGALTAALSGGAAAAGQGILDPDHFDLRHTGAVFLAGAVIGLLNWLRTSPWNQGVVDAAKLKLPVA